VPLTTFNTERNFTTLLLQTHRRHYHHQRGNANTATAMPSSRDKTSLTRKYIYKTRALSSTTRSSVYDKSERKWIINLDFKIESKQNVRRCTFYDCPLKNQYTYTDSIVRAAVPNARLSVAPLNVISVIYAQIFPNLYMFMLLYCKYYTYIYTYTYK